MSHAWSPPEHAFSYAVHEELDGGVGTDFDLTPPTATTAVNLATVRVGRRGGDRPEDLAFREDLFQLVGSITVAGGHIEASMKRLLLLLTGGPTVFSLVDHLWSDLENKLQAQCDGSDERRRGLQQVLKWADGHQLRDQRNTVVHGAWWVYAGVGARVSRWPRKAEDRVIVGDIADLQQLDRRCWAFAQRLDDLVAEDWPRAVLPAPQPSPTWPGSGGAQPLRR